MRRLPDDPVKRRIQIFKRLYQHLNHFQAQVEAGNFPMPLVITIPNYVGPDGEDWPAEDVFIDDLMVGIDALPPRQREAFELICLGGWTETDATRKMLPDSQWSTPIQQYADTALARMIKSYDEKQAGTFVHTVYQPKTKAKEHPNGQTRTQAQATADRGVLTAGTTTGVA